MPIIFKEVPTCQSCGGPNDPKKPLICDRCWIRLQNKLFGWYKPAKVQHLTPAEYDNLLTHQQMTRNKWSLDEIVLAVDGLHKDCSVCDQIRQVGNK